MPSPIRWPNVAARDRDEISELAGVSQEVLERLLSQARRDGDDSRISIILEAMLNQERILRLAERNGAPKYDPKR